MFQGEASSNGAAPAPIPMPLHQTLNWLLQQRDLEAAKALLASITRAASCTEPATVDYLAQAFCLVGDFASAATWAHETAKLLPQSPAAHFNLAKCLAGGGDSRGAELCLREAMALAPRWSEPRIDLSANLAQRGAFAEAEGLLLAALALEPGDTALRRRIQYDLARYHLRRGDVPAGLRGLILGREMRVWGTFFGDCPRPRLRQGESLAGKRLLIIGEGGAGDEMIGVRFAATAKARGAHVIYAAKKPLHGLFSRVSAIDELCTLEDVCVVDQQSAASAFHRSDYDLWAPSLDLPHLLQLEARELHDGPYLHAEQNAVARWQERIPACSGRLRVGLRWQGDVVREKELNRSLPFAELEAFSAMGLDLYSLQRDDGVEELTPSSPVTDLAPYLSSWDETAAAIANLDLVLTSCTAVAHLAAAMGKQTFVLCAFHPYYVWVTGDDRSPWYSNVRLFRQSQDGRWDQALQDVAKALASLQELTVRRS